MINTLLYNLNLEVIENLIKLEELGRVKLCPASDEYYDVIDTTTGEVLMAYNNDGTPLIFADEYITAGDHLRHIGIEGGIFL